MKKLIEEMKNHMLRGEESVLVTITASSGSTPRGAGARMLVCKDGSTIGSIGGGMVEYQARQTAARVMEKKTSYVKGFSLDRSQTADIGMICGGEVMLYFQYIHPGDHECLSCCDLLLQALKKNEDSWLVMDITDEKLWKMGLYTHRDGFSLIDIARNAEEVREKQGEWFGNRPVFVRTAGKRYYIEPFVQEGMVYVFGGGHVAQELVPLLTHVGFRCIVVDDRKEFANTDVFAQAEKVMAENLEDISSYLSITSRDYVCIMTRGHQFDYLIQRQVMAMHPAYIGVIGSRNKIQITAEKLLADGFSREEIESCHMPIGTAIRAETPAEIAVSIAGELIAVRAERMGRKRISASWQK